MLATFLRMVKSASSIALWADTQRQATTTPPTTMKNWKSGGTTPMTTPRARDNASWSARRAAEPDAGKPFRKVRETTRFMLEDFTDEDVWTLLGILVEELPQHICGVVCEYWEKNIECRS
jgi:hypothetical protein